MFRWYRNAARCYVYLSDVSTTSNEQQLAQQQSPVESAFQASRWFTRGWTLQELIAPTSVEFFTREGTRLGDKKSLEQQIHKITGIPIPALRGTPLSQFDIDERFTWANTRETTREEDWSYCLLGIFDVFIPLIYGEGKKHAVWRLKKAINEVPHRQGQLQDTASKQGQEKIKWLQKLYTCPYRDRKNRNPAHVKGTCAWFLGHPLFHSWQQGSGASLLWVSADPGCGKSVLVRCLVDSVLLSTSTRTTCYFFFKEDFEDQRSSTGAMCCILHQIFTQYPTVFSDSILSKFEQKGDMVLTSFQDLWDILISVANNLGGHEIVCIFDALDECEKSGRSQIIAATSSFYSHTSTPAIKFLLTSRPYLDIKRGFQRLEDKLPTIHLSGENEEEVDKISQEIDLVIRAKVKDVPGLSEEEQNVLGKELTAVPNRTYLWVHLVFNVIMDGIFYTQESLRSMTRKLPQSVEEAYDKILSKSRDIGLTRKLLHIVVAAKEPLTLKEMALALAIRSSHRSFCAIELMPEERFRIDVRELCGLFVVVVDSKIYLLHQTAREFLVPSLSSDPELSSPRETALDWKYSLRPEESHRVLAEICLWRLSLSDFDLDSFRSSKNRKEYIAERTFLDYSTRFWAAHFRECHWVEDGWAMETAERYCSFQYPASRAWFEIHFETYDVSLQDVNFTPLLVASWFGLGQILERLLKGGSSDVNGNDSTYGRPALFWATSKGHADVAQQLLASGADVKAQDDSGGTALHGAAVHDNSVHDNSEALMRLLLKAGADVNAKDKINSTPLHHAVVAANPELVETLLVAGADANAKDCFGNTALWYAANIPNEAITRHLLAGGAGVNVRNGLGDTALYVAITFGREAIVRILLEAGADVNGENELVGTPLHHAASVGSEAILQMLLETGANVNAKNAVNRTPLHYAIGSKRDETLVQRLLAGGADVYAKDGFHHTPLSYLPLTGNNSLRQLLLAAGARRCKQEE